MILETPLEALVACKDQDFYRERNFLLVKSLLTRKRVCPNNLCSIYLNHEEIIEHMLLGCKGSMKA